MKSLDIICPVFREQEVIGLFHARLMTTLEKLGSGFKVRVIYVLDPSPDSTEAILRNIACEDDRIEVLVMSRRFGHQAALIAGIDESRSDAIVMLDSDLQHPPELILELVRRWSEGAEIVQTIRKDGKNIGYLKRKTSKWFYDFLFRVGSVDLKSGAADYRLISRRVADIFKTELQERNPFLRGLTSWVGFNICYVPFETAEREHGTSKYRVSTLVNFALNGICSFSKLPLRFCIGVGLIISIGSMIVAALLLLLYFAGNSYAPGWASIFAMMTFLGGIQLFFLGILGEYVSLIFDEVKRRPRYLIQTHYCGTGFVGASDEPASAEVPYTRQISRQPTVDPNEYSHA
jgi:dolichol-phosphate mannosyltransferase